MLIEFSVKNYLSFKDRVVLSMVASKDKIHPRNVIADAGGTGIDLLKVAAVYGANASGKSNLIKALEFMCKFIVNSHVGTDTTRINVVPFKLDASCANKPSEFEMIFISEGVRYRYGFVVDTEKVHEEWLYHAPKGKEALLFERYSGEPIKFGTSLKGEKKAIEGLTRKNALFLSTAAQFDNKTANALFSYFHFMSGNMKSYILSNEFQYDDFIKLNVMFINELPGSDFKKKIASKLQLADTGIKSINLKYPADIIDKLGPALKDDEKAEVVEKERFLKNLDDSVKVKFAHYSMNEDGVPGEAMLDLSEESDGTRKYILLWLFLLIRGAWSSSVIAIDEMDMGLHPLLAEEFIRDMFMRETESGLCGQMIFTTHNTNLLDPEIFRRDQIWFAEKDHATGATSLFSLSDIKDVRTGEDFSKKYLDGKYGAIPILRKFDSECVNE